MEPVSLTIALEMHYPPGGGCHRELWPLPKLSGLNSPMYKRVFAFVAFLKARWNRALTLLVECILVKVHSFPRTTLKYTIQMLKSLCACLSRQRYEEALNHNGPLQSFSVNCTSTFCHTAAPIMQRAGPAPYWHARTCRPQLDLWQQHLDPAPLQGFGLALVRLHPKKGSFPHEASCIPAFLCNNKKVRHIHERRAFK